MTWVLDRINASDDWEKRRLGYGFRGAVSDTRVDIDHPDLERKMVTVDEDDPYYSGGWIEFDRLGEIVKYSIPHDTDGYSTHCSGTVLDGNASGTHRCSNLS